MPPQTQISLPDEKEDIDRARRLWEIIPTGHKIGDPKPLFEELVQYLSYAIFNVPSSPLFYF